MKHRAFFPTLILALVLASTLLLTVGAVSAQVSTLAYGQTISGTISATAPLNIYSFQGNPGDLAIIEITALSQGFEPTIGVTNPRQEGIGSSTSDVSRFGSGDASVAVVLPETGIYTVLIGSENGTAGDYILRLYGMVSRDAGALGGTALSIRFDTPGATVFSVNGDPNLAMRLTVEVDTPNALVRALLVTSTGQVVSSASGNTSLGLSLPPMAGSFRLIVIFVGGSPASVMVSLNGAGGVPGVVATQDVTAPVSSSGQCVISPANPGGANIRSGPSEAFNVIGMLAAGQQIAPNGQNSGWYAVPFNGVQGWIFSGVVNSGGDCSTLPLVQAPAAPQQPQQPAQPTQAPQQQAQPTATTAQQQVQPTATTAAQVAPTDGGSNGVLLVPLDGSAQIGDYVSFPGGDTQDQISYDVSGLNPNVAFSGGQATLTITAVCTGTGTENIRFSADGGQQFGCGQTVLTRIVNNDSRNGGVRITAIGGTNTYVQWTLIGNAPRVN